MAPVDPKKTEATSAILGSSFGSGCLIVNAVLTFVFTLLVSHNLSQSQAGGLFETIALFTTASVIATFGADIGLMRLLPKYLHSNRRTLRRTLLVATLPILLLGTVFAVFVAVDARQLDALLVPSRGLRAASTTDLRVLAAIIPAGGISAALVAALRTWSVMWPFVVQYVLLPLLRVILFIAAVAFAAMTPQLATLAWGGPVAVTALTSVYLVGSSLRRRQPSNVPRAHEPQLPELTREFWLFALPRSLESTLIVFLTGFDIILAGALGGAKIAASYTVATRFISFATFGVIAVQIALSTTFSYLMQHGKHHEGVALYRVTSWWCTAICWPPMIALAVFAPTLMHLFGSGYTQGDTALVVMAAAGLVIGATGPSAPMILMSGHTVANVCITLLAIAVNLPLDFLLIHRMGATGAAIAWAASTCISNILQVVVLRHRYGANPLCGEQAFVAGLAVLLFGGLGIVARLAFPAGTTEMLLYAAVSSAAYLLVLYWKRNYLQLDEVIGRVGVMRRNPPQAAA